MTLSEHAARNRVWWDAQSDAYQQRHGAFIGRAEPRWGVWQLPESELRILGDVSGKDVLELGCGAAQWSILLAQRGAQPVGLDNSERQLEHALRPGGLLAFCLISPLAVIAQDPESELIEPVLHRDYFGLYRLEDDAVEFNLPYGEWVRLFRSHGLLVEDLVEPPPADAQSTYWEARERDWARRWPSEAIWKARKP